MKIKLEKTLIFAIYLVCFLIIAEIGVNCCAFHYLFPIKNASSFGYVTINSQRTIVPLNKYSKRIYSQLALPFEAIESKIKDKNLTPDYDAKTNRFGYTDKNKKTIIEHKYFEANEFKGDSAIVAILKDNKKLYGTIDKSGKWIIEPKYEFLCPFGKYYTRACIDNFHCGVIDKYGNEVTLLTYTTDKLDAQSNTYKETLCSVGTNYNPISCNYFL